MKEIIGALLIIGLLGCCSAASCPDPCNESNQFSKQPCQGDCTKFWMCNAYVPGNITSQFFDCCEDQNGEIWYFDPKKEECSLDESVCIPEVPIVCPDPCNESNQFSKQPCEGDCTKFWMCNAYIPGVVTSNLLCCDGKDGEQWYFDPIKQECSLDEGVCDPEDPIDCADPCNESNQFSKQPCVGDCTKFWMCNAYVPGNVTSKLFDCCEGKDGVKWYFDPIKQECSLDEGVCDPKDPVECADPCNESNQFTNQPCDDCTKFWMCNAYVPGNVTSLLIDCCEDKNGVKWYYDRKKGECSLDENVCPK